MNPTIEKPFGGRIASGTGQAVATAWQVIIFYRSLSVAKQMGFSG